MIMSLLDPLRMHWDIWECIFLHVATSHSFYGSFLPIMLAFQVQGNYRSCTFFSAIFQRTESPILEAPSTSAGCQKWDVKHMYGILSSLCHPEQGRAPDDGKFFQGRGRYSGVGKVVKGEGTSMERVEQVEHCTTVSYPLCQSAKPNMEVLKSALAK